MGRGSTMTNSIISNTLAELYSEYNTNQITATYSAEDNALRLRTDIHFNNEQWALIKKMGFKYAPKQKLLVAHRWTPNREDFVLFLAGSITAEQTTLVERAQNKAIRLDALAEKRTIQASQYMDAANRIAQRITHQPIIANHHSASKMLRTQNQLEGAKKNVVWALSAINYWGERAEAVEHHANRKSDFGVRSRRIGVLLKDLRTHQRKINFAHSALALWEKISQEKDEVIKEKHISYMTGVRSPEGQYSPEGYYDDLKDEKITLKDALQNSIVYCRNNTQSVYTLRWINHILNRLAFERNELGLVYSFEGKMTAAIIQTFLRSQGAEKPKAKKVDNNWFVSSSVPFPLHIADDKEFTLTEEQFIQLMQSTGYEVPATREKAPSILNFKANSILIQCFGDKKIYKQVELTKAEYAKIYQDYRCVRLSACGTFRVKTCINPNRESGTYGGDRVCVFITDSKIHDKPNSSSIDATMQLENFAEA